VWWSAHDGRRITRLSAESSLATFPLGMGKTAEKGSTTPVSLSPAEIFLSTVIESRRARHPALLPPRTRVEFDTGSSIMIHL
jgi:hypothetical protein